MLQLLKKRRALIMQVVLVLVLLLFFVRIGVNYYRNISSRNIGIGFGFLNDTAGFSISQTLIAYTEADTFGRTFVVGLLNTLLASVIAIVLATIFGFILGLMRLSRNWLAARSSLAIVEFLRNIPPLLHVLFWYQVFFLRILPPLKESWALPGGVFVNIRGITVPEIHLHSGGWYFWYVLGLALVSLIILARYQRFEIQHGRHHKFWPWYLVILSVPVWVIIFFSPFYLVMPELSKFRFTTGVTLLPELFSIIIAMATYTSSYIAEIVRNSIVGVQRGQVEAAQSLGLTRSQSLRLVIVPQALMTMVPPVTNQYLNIIKNTSLGVAIAYPDLTAVFAGTALNQSGRALEIMLMVMFTYLAVNLLVSLLMNIYNGRIVDRKGRPLSADQIVLITAELAGQAAPKTGNGPRKDRNHVVPDQ